MVLCCMTTTRLELLNLSQAFKKCYPVEAWQYLLDFNAFLKSSHKMNIKNSFKLVNFHVSVVVGKMINSKVKKKSENIIICTWFQYAICWSTQIRVYVFWLSAFSEVFPEVYLQEVAKNFFLKKCIDKVLPIISLIRESSPVPS